MQLPATVFYVVRGKKIIILVPTKWGCLLPREIFSASMRQNFYNLCPLLMRRCFSYGRIGGLALGATLLCSKCGARASSLALYILNFQCVKSSLHQTSVCVCAMCRSWYRFWNQLRLLCFVNSLFWFIFCATDKRGIWCLLANTAGVIACFIILR